MEKLLKWLPTDILRLIIDYGSRHSYIRGADPGCHLEISFSSIFGLFHSEQDDKTWLPYVQKYRVDGRVEETIVLHARYGKIHKFHRKVREVYVAGMICHSRRIDCSRVTGVFAHDYSGNNFSYMEEIKTDAQKTEYMWLEFKRYSSYLLVPKKIYDCHKVASKNGHTKSTVHGKIDIYFYDDFGVSMFM